MGSIVNAVLVRGLVAFERAWPMPARLGEPLAAELRPGAQADPIVLVSGFANTPVGWEEWVRSLRADGFRVFVVDLSEDGLGDMHRAAAEVAGFIEQVKRQTGAGRVDLVGFSEGGILNRMVIARGGASSVDRAISLATPHHGVAFGSAVRVAARIPGLRALLPTSLVQMIEGSQLLTDLARDERSASGGQQSRTGVRWASIYSQVIDGAVAPWSSQLDGAVNIPVVDDAGRPGRGANHFTMFHLSDRAYEAARALLLDQPDAVARELGRGVPQRTIRA